MDLDNRQQIMAEMENLLSPHTWNVTESLYLEGNSVCLMLDPRPDDQGTFYAPLTIIPLVGQPSDLEGMPILLHAISETGVIHYGKLNERGQLHFHQLSRGNYRAEVMLEQASETLLQTVTTRLTQTAADWTKEITGWGQGWLEKETGRWRQIQLALGELQTSSQSAALPTMLGPNDGADSETEVQHITLFDGGLEVKISKIPEGEVAQPTSASESEDERCRLEVTIFLRERFGDFSGLSVTLMGLTKAYRDETDQFGKVAFRHIPCTDLETMNVVVQIP